MSNPLSSLTPLLETLAKNIDVLPAASAKPPYTGCLKNGLNTRRERLKRIDSLQPLQEKTAWELDKEASQHRHVHAPNQVIL